MDWNIIEGKWKELSGSIREKWADLTDDEIQQAKGNREKLSGIIQQKYGLAKEEAEKQIDEWKDRLK